MFWLKNTRGKVIRPYLLGALLFLSTCDGMAARAYAVSSQPGAGVSHALAIARAKRVDDLHYRLELGLAAHADAIIGHEWITFELGTDATEQNLPLDFRQGSIQSVSLNGSSIPTASVEGHLILPAEKLRQGKNTVEILFSARVATAGAALTRYEDKDDGSEYIYSLFVPMDASMAFPCFDQPDLKAQFTLRVNAPAEWTVISNTRANRTETPGHSTWTFEETKPISTYLFAFAAGPWTTFPGGADQPTVYVRRSQRKRAEPEMPQLQSITARGMAWLTDYFQQPFPFPKYDLVLIPGFPFGGMEHAGATFLNEDGVLFRTAPTASDRFRRDILTLHELTHQWFGDLVTMRWFDDLWLKEGFAQYMAYRCLDALDPDAHAWKHFYEDVKPLAYGIDETEGTTPIFQDIPNLKDAKSAYGAIVYQKAPAILKQLEFRLGPDSFRDGLRLYLKQHAYANAQWSDLIDAFHAASGQDVRSWADAWVLRRGMPEITATWHCDARGRLAALKLHQRDALPDGFVWPISNEVRLEPQGDTMKVDWSTPDISVHEAVGKACPRYVFANAGDYAYGRFLLDPKSETFVSSSFAARRDIAKEDPLMRSMLWGAIWENVRLAKTSPLTFVQLVRPNLFVETDESLFRIQGNRVSIALHAYLGPLAREAVLDRIEGTLTSRMTTADLGIRIDSFRVFTSIAESRHALGVIESLLDGSLQIEDMPLKPLDRWNLIGHLIAMHDPDASALFAAEQQHDKSGEGKKYAYAVEAGRPDLATKQRYWNDYLHDGALQEDWIAQSLGPFNSWNQAALTEPYLTDALNQLPEIKVHRKIFFLGEWLNTFLGGQHSLEAQAAVHTWLQRKDIDPDLRLKLLQASYDLDRTVRIRTKYPD